MFASSTFNTRPTYIYTALLKTVLIYLHGLYILGFWDSSNRDSTFHVFLYNSPASLRTDYVFVLLQFEFGEECGWFEQNEFGPVCKSPGVSRCFFKILLFPRTPCKVYFFIKMLFGCQVWLNKYTKYKEGQKHSELVPAPPAVQLWRHQELFVFGPSWIRENPEASSLAIRESRASRNPFPSPLSEPVVASSWQDPSNSDISPSPSAFLFPFQLTLLLAPFSKNTVIMKASMVSIMVCDCGCLGAIFKVSP